MIAPRRLLSLLTCALTLSFAAPAALAQTAAFTATVTTDSADLHDRANNGSSVVDHVFKGTKLPVFGLSPDKQWVRVKGPAGTAWVARAQVAVTRGAPPENEAHASSAASRPNRPSTHEASSHEASTHEGGAADHSTRHTGPGLNGPKKFAYVVVPKTNVLLNANDSSPTLAIASRNDVFEVGGFSRDKSYVKVRTEDGRIGWISKSDLRPGRPEVTSAPKEKPTRHKEEVEDRPPRDDFPPERPSRRMASGDSDTKLWFDGGMLLFSEKVTSNEGYGYKLNGSGYGAGIRFEHSISGGFGIEGGYLGTMNQRLPAQGANTTVFSTTHRLDIAARYKFEFTDEEGPSITALAGFQNYTFYVQPQSLDFFYSQVYNSGMIGLGGEFGVGSLRIGADGRYLVPVLAGERYGSGQKGADGQSVTATGISFGANVGYHFYSGATLGLNLRAHSYNSVWSGTGLRGVSENGSVVAKKLSGVKVADQFTTITLTYSRGF